jgi:hypothetical protein
MCAFLPSHLQVKTEVSFEKHSAMKFKEVGRTKPRNHTFKTHVVNTSYYKIKPKSKPEWKQK